MARADGNAGHLLVEVAYSPRAGQTLCCTVQLPPGATLGDALRASRFDVGALPAGIWGRIQPADTALRDRDRVEVYRPLQVEPKQARRLRHAARARQHGR